MAQKQRASASNLIFGGINKAESKVSILYNFWLLLCLNVPTMEIDDHGDFLSSSGWGHLHLSQLSLLSFEIQSLRKLLIVVPSGWLSVGTCDTLYPQAASLRVQLSTREDCFFQFLIFYSDKAERDWTRSKTAYRESSPNEHPRATIFVLILIIQECINRGGPCVRASLELAGNN